jgi:hypothetical protein
MIDSNDRKNDILRLNLNFEHHQVVRLLDVTSDFLRLRYNPVIVPSVPQISVKNMASFAVHNHHGIVVVTVLL